MVGGRDATLVPIEFSSSDVGGAILTFTDRPTEVTGQISTDSSVVSATVLLFPADRSAWVGYGSSSRRFSATRVGHQRSFKVTNLPAGDYLAAAIPDRLATDWQDPEFLQSLVQDATRVRVPEAGRVSVTLRIVR
jgi:hypothetical protein